jgi:outer membrane protein
MIARLNRLYCLSRRGMVVPALSMFAAFMAAGQTQDSLTIDKAVEIVLKRHPSVAQAQEALAASREHTQGLKCAYYPFVNAIASDVYLGPQYPFNLGVAKFPMFPDNNFDAHIGADYTVFDFGKRRTSVETGTIGEANASDRLRSVKTGLYYQVSQLFTTIILEQKSVRVADDAIAELDRHLLDVKKKFETGSATEYDVLKTEVQRAGARNRRIDIGADLTKKQAVLRQLLGLPPDAAVPLQGGFDTLFVPLNADSLIQSAVQNRSDYAMVLHTKQSAQLQRQSAKIENLPVVGVHASAGFKNGFPDDEPPPNTDITTPRFNWSAGAQVSVPVFDGMRARHREREAERSEEAAAAAVNDLEERLKTDVLQAKADVEATYSKLDISRTQVQFANRSLELARLKYDAGVLTNLDVLDAENDFSEAQLGHLQNQYRYVMSRYSLGQATGAFPAAR